MSDPTALEPGQERTTTVIAKRLYNPTDTIVEQGQRYEFHVPEDDTWTDRTIECGPGGWFASEAPWWLFPFIKLLEHKRRVPNAPWFCLCGTIGKADDHAFIIPLNTPFTADLSGHLYLFANDLENRYSNNSGSLRVTIRRETRGPHKGLPTDP